MSRAQILRLLGNAGLRRILAQHGGGLISLGANDDDDEEDNDDDDDNGFGAYSSAFGSRRRRRRSAEENTPPPPVPSPEGQKLMESGTFGSNEYYQDALRKRKKRLAQKLMYRELGTDLHQLRRANKSIAQVCGSGILRYRH